MVYLELFGAAEANFLFNIAEPTRFLWRIFIFDLQSMVFHVFWPSDHSPGWWLDLYYSYPLIYIYIYTYIYIYYIHIIYIYIYMCIRCWKAWREMYIYIYIYILGYIKGMIRIYETHVFFFIYYISNSTTLLGGQRLRLCALLLRQGSAQHRHPREVRAAGTGVEVVANPFWPYRRR